MTERDFYPLWKKYLEVNPPIKTEVFELKLVKLNKTKSFSFNSVHDYQVDSLLASLDGLYQRIMDQPYVAGGFQQRKLCDSLWIKTDNAWVVVIFYTPRKKKIAVKIPIKVFIRIKNNWKRKSIRFEELIEQVGVEVVEI